MSALLEAASSVKLSSVNITRCLLSAMSAFECCPGECLGCCKRLRQKHHCGAAVRQPHRLYRQRDAGRRAGAGAAAGTASAHLTLVPHNAAIFKGTVESNLRMAKPDADEAQLWAALEQVNLADFCRSQNGLQTALHEAAAIFPAASASALPWPAPAA